MNKYLMEKRFRRMVLERARHLVNTSMQDMQSGLHLYASESSLQVLRRGLRLVKRRGEKTKAIILQRKIKQLEKELGNE